VREWAKTHEQELQVGNFIDADEVFAFLATLEEGER
jgi:hypothetical protein